MQITAVSRWNNKLSSVAEQDASVARDKYGVIFNVILPRSLLIRYHRLPACKLYCSVLFHLFLNFANKERLSISYDLFFLGGGGELGEQQQPVEMIG